MLRVMVLAAVVTAMAGPSLAEMRCSKPFAPVVKLGPTKQDLATLRDDVTSFIAASDAYQQCLVARDGSSAITLIEANQAEKERVGKTFNAVVRSVKAPG